MNKITRNTFGVLTLLIGFIPFIPTLGSIDLIAPQYVYLSVIQLIIVLLIAFLSPNKNIGFDKIDFFYFLFLFFSILSVFKSENIQESIIEFSRYLTLFISFLNLKILYSSEFSKKLFLLIIFSLATIESSIIFNIFLNNFSLESGLGKIRELQGLSSNQNIGAFSLLIKVPLLIFLITKLKNKFYKYLVCIVLLICLFDILIIASRAAIIGLILILIFLLTIYPLKNVPLKLKKVTPIYALFLVFAFIIQILLYQNSYSSSSLNRLSNYNDNSTKERVDYTKTSLSMIKQNPILGIGIGNWKITSLREYNSKVTEYKVPFHAHNDFLQIAAEIGVFGFFSYFLVFVFPLYIFIKKLFIDKSDLDSLQIFLIISILIFIWDSLINFPRIRPYSQMNILYILAYYSNFYLKKIEFISIKPRTFALVIILLLIPLNFLHARVFDSYKEIYYLYYDFNLNGLNLKATTNDIKDYQDFLPNITNTTIPIKLSKANYYINEKKYELAKKLIFEGNKSNPHLGFGEYLLSKIYYEQGDKDSSMFYIKRAVEKVPMNSAHAALYQTLLSEKNDFEAESNYFKKVKNLKSKTVWMNHFFIQIRKNSEFKELKEDIKLALELFPDDNLFKSFELITEGEITSAKLANKLDALAQYEFENKNFTRAISFWEEAKKLVPNEDSYFLNIAYSYCYLDDYDNAINQLKLLEKNELKTTNGFFEFIAGYAFYYKGDRNLGCLYMLESNKLGYSAAKSFLKKINCQL